MTEVLHTCPKCRRSGFTTRGLRVHVCRPERDNPASSSMLTKQTAETLEIVTAVPTAGAIVPAPANLKQLAGEINETHAVAKSHAQLAVVFALRTGLLCERAKEALPHGQFGGWLEKHCPEVTTRTAQKYMALAKSSLGELTAGAKNESGSYLPTLLLAHDFAERVEDDAGYRNQISAQTRDVVGEGSLTDLYREYGVVHGPRNEDDTGKRKHYPAKKLTAEERAKELRQTALREIRAALKHVDSTLLRAKAYRHCTSAEIARFDEELGDLAKKFHVVALRAAQAAKTGSKRKAAA